MFKRVISTCMAALLMTQAAFFDAPKQGILTSGTNETTVMETSGDIITSEEALTEAGILTDEEPAEPEETEEPDEETTTEAVTEDDISSETTTETSEATTESPDEETATTETSEETTQMTEQPEEPAEEETEEAVEEEIELYAAGSCTVVRTGSYSALGAPGHTFSTVIDGKTYYPLCCDSSKGSTDASGAAYNLEGLITKDPSSMIYKTMYYGYGGPEQWSGFSSTDEAVVATARNLSYYTNNDGTPGNNFFRFLQTADTPPAHTFQLSSTDASLSDVTYNGNVYQGSNWITLNMDARLTAELDAPSDVIIQINSGGSISNYSGTTGIDIAGGEAFRVLGAKSLSGDKTVKLHYDGDKMIAVYGLSPAGNSSLQRLLYRDQENPAKDITFRFSGLGALKINKKSADESVTKNNDCYDFEGIEYALYKQGTRQQLATFVMDKDGKGAVGEITAAGQTAGISKGGTYLLNVPLGNYDIQETKTNGHYNIDTKAYGVTINQAYDSNQSDTVCEKTFTDTPKMDPVVMGITKQNEEGKEVKGAADLEGAQYTIKYYAGDYELNNLPATATRTWVIQTIYDEVINSYTARLSKSYLVSGDAFYLDEFNRPSLPHGTITIQETKAPEGYKLEGGKLYLTGASTNDNIQISGDIVLAKVTDAGLNVRVNSSNSVDVDSAAGINILQKEEMIRGDFSLVKKDYRTGEGMAYIPFLIESKTTGEKHVVCTDENGVFSTASSFQNHSVNTNGNDVLMDEAIIDDIQPCGVWFYGNEKAESSTGADDIKGALPYDTYVITELLCERNRDYQLAEPFEVTIDSEGAPAATREIVNVPNPELQTTARDKNTGTNTGRVAESVTIADTAGYKNLTVGKEYIIRGILMNKATGKPLLVNGKTVEAEKTFTAETADGFVEMEFTFDSSALAGTSVVVFERLYQNEIEVCSHADLEDEGQTINYPELQTMARDKATGTNTGRVAESVTIADTAGYKNLTVGKEYTIKGILMDKTTGAPLLVNGKTIEAEKTFTAETADGFVEMEFTFDSSALAGTSVVVFERLYQNDIEVCSHADLEDEGQTVYVSEPPKTGDRNQPFIIFSIAVLCLLGIMLLISCRKRTEKRCGK